MLSPNLLAFAVAALLVVLPPAPGVAARPIIAGKPGPSEAAATARWLAAQNTWGVLRFQFHPNPSAYNCPCNLELSLVAQISVNLVSLTHDHFVCSTISSDLGGAPFGNVVSYSDGVPGEGHGIPYFYLTTLDPTARDALEDERTSFTLSEFPLGTCGKIDPENPTCAKLTLTGKLKLVDLQSSEADLAKSALFTKHPEMKGKSILLNLQDKSSVKFS
ncbi:hypothetical protein PR202_ga17607 [Eleusine coracana subsp. coracana]|uniref:CREG-like beta-barrel domain-containing protein n=1 Tax=Eleusine coracana subsp. coracana TaxID=191504 RepID=A0AAV5CNY1_ELECO|nr:hypothetical protein PR202_ga17360 [Eleusine coracana subsp. coracana]GJN00425.1 hypothetical protein PR202_ga17607 [Eleusine coracana subsp. coracana]